ncbi:MAG TPA: ABC transporter permease [Gemmatimonadaceae bacterium]|nr:ABC transporter permease [Gemmatimonadaceae bacterium]
MSELAAFALLGDVLVRATPLILAGLAVAVAFQGGVLNIGAEGQLLIGACTSTAVSLKLGSSLGPVAIVVALIIGMLAGALWAAIAAELTNRFHVLEVISTIMLNFVALYLISFLVRGPLQEPTKIYPQTSTIAPSAQLPVILEGTRLHIGFILAIAAGLLAWWGVRNTAAGFRLRLTGANPRAARIAGMINVERTTRNVFLISGALAGLAGAIEVHGVTFALYENISPGYGYTAIAVALLAGLNPAWVIASGILFGALEAGASALQRDAGVPSTLVWVVEAAVILIVLGTESYRSRRSRRFVAPELAPAQGAS